MPTLLLACLDTPADEFDLVLHLPPERRFPRPLLSALPFHKLALLVLIPVLFACVPVPAHPFEFEPLHDSNCETGSWNGESPKGTEFD